MQINYVKECENCGFPITKTEIDREKNHADIVNVDLDFFGGFIMTCPKCGEMFYIPKIEEHIIRRGEKLE